MPVPQEVALIIPNFRNSYAVGWLESRSQQEKQSFVIILPTPSADVGLNFIEMKIHRALLYVNVTRTLNLSQISLLFAISFHASYSAAIFETAVVSFTLIFRCSDIKNREPCAMV